MNGRQIVWTSAGDTEWAACGHIKVSLTKVLPAKSGTVSVCVRIGDWVEGDDQGTPAYFHFAADRLDAEIRTLKGRIEQHLVIGADDPAVATFLASAVTARD